MQAEFVASAGRPDQFPSEGPPEVAFLGRSNVGKSSLINTLTGQKRLAFTSSTPGRTQSINFYRIHRGEGGPGALYFVDLPGYGFARAPKEQVHEWKELIDGYLTERRSLRLSILILDVRRGWMEKDLQLKRWLESQGRRYLVVATKTDKFSKSEAEQRLRLIRQEQVEALPFSAVTGRGVRELWQAISKTTSNHP